MRSSDCRLRSYAPRVKFLCPTIRLNRYNVQLCDFLIRSNLSVLYVTALISVTCYGSLIYNPLCNYRVFLPCKFKARFLVSTFVGTLDKAERVTVSLRVEIYPLINLAFMVGSETPKLLTFALKQRNAFSSLRLFFTCPCYIYTGFCAQGDHIPSMFNFWGFLLSLESLLTNRCNPLPNSTLR